MKAKLIILICSLALSNNLGAQFGWTNFQAGKIITLEGDTLEGEIKFVPGYHKIQFRNTTNYKIQEFLPFDIAGFNYYREGWFAFESCKCLDYRKGRGVFMEKVMNGKLNVYRIWEDNRYFFDDAGFLGSQYCYGRTNKELVRHKKKNFNKELVRLMSDCKEVLLDLGTPGYQYQDLIAIAANYNSSCN